MKHKLFRITSFFVSIVAVFSLLPSQLVLAAPSSIYFSPTSGTYNVNANFSVQVRGNSDSLYYNRATTSGSVTFPTSRLKVISVSTSGSSYSDINTSVNNSNGTVSWSGSAYPTPTSIYFFTINFQAVSGGSAGLGFSSDTNVHHNAYYQINSTNKGTANFTINTPTCPSGQVGTPPNCTTPPPPTCPSGQVGTPPNCTTPSTPKPNPTPTPTPTPSPTPRTPTVRDTSVPTATAQPDVAPVQVDAGDLSIKDVVAKVTRKSNALEWKTTLSDVNSEITVGTSKESLTVKPTVTKQADGSFVSTMENLKPGVRYYFMITATAINNPEKKATFSGAFTTRGYPVTLVVTKEGKKIANATVTLEKQSFKTDKNGELQLELTDTSFSAIVTLPDKTTKTVNFTVAKKAIPSDGGNPPTQTFTFDLTEQAASTATNNSSFFLPLLGGIGALAALLVGGALFLLYRRRKAEQDSGQATVAPYTWEQQSTSDPIEEPTTPYHPALDAQQAASLASIEQQYIPESELQPETAYEAQQALAPDVTTPLQQPETATMNYAAPPIEAAAPIEEMQDVTSDTAPETVQTTISAEDIAQPMTDASSPVYASDTSTQLPTEDTTTAAEEPNQEDEEEAVYHPDTGELDIIHNHNTPVTPMPTEPLPDESDVDNLPLPPQTNPSIELSPESTSAERALQ